MRARQRGPTWLTVLALLAYALAPLSFAFGAPPPTVLRCEVAVPDACGCPPSNHVGGSCCCGHTDRAGHCRLNPAPCNGGQGAEGVTWTARSPLPHPPPPLRLGAADTSCSWVLPAGAATRSLARSPATPPPQV